MTSCVVLPNGDTLRVDRYADDVWSRPAPLDRPVFCGSIIREMQYSLNNVPITRQQALDLIDEMRFWGLGGA